MKPNMNILKKGKKADLKIEQKILLAKNQSIINLVKQLGIAKIEGFEFTRGPSTSLLELRVDPSTNLDRLKKSADNFSLLLGTQNVRIMTPVPERPYIGIEYPNENRDVPSLRGLLEKGNTEMEIPVALGFDSAYNPIVEDLTKSPHLLVAGSTGSGKSVCINTMINSILFTKTEEEVQFLMVDPKMVELSVYENIPHLIGKVATSSEEAKLVLDYALLEMKERYEKLTTVGARNIKSYAKITGEKLPYIVLIIDEYADLMAVAKKEVEETISRLAAMSRAVGMHIILATQRPSADVVTGVIKANFPSRISFRVASSIDSRTIIDTRGAEKLLGKGDMLYLKPGDKLKRIQGTYLSDEEVNEVVSSFNYTNTFLENETKPSVNNIFSDYSEETIQGIFEDMLILNQPNVRFLMKELKLSNREYADKLYDAMCVKYPDILAKRQDIHDAIANGVITI